MIVVLVATDIVGFSELSSKLEREELEKFVEKHTEMVRNIFKKYGGDVIKFTGDGFLGILNSTEKIQTFVEDLKNSVPETKYGKPDIKIAVSLGDIDFVNGDIVGSDVNLVFRMVNSLKSGIAFSEKIYPFVKNYPYLATMIFKGFPEPIRIYGKADITQGDDAKFFFKKSTFLKRWVAFYLDISIFTFTLGILGLPIMESIKTRKEIIERGKSILKIESPIVSFEVLDDGVKFKTEGKEFLLSPSQLEITSREKILLSLKANYLHFTVFEITMFSLFLAFSTFIFGSTIGEKIIGLKTLTKNGEKPKILRTVLRNVLGFVLVIPQFVLSFILLLLKKENFIIVDELLGIISVDLD